MLDTQVQPAGASVFQDEIQQDKKGWLLITFFGQMWGVEALSFTHYICFSVRKLEEVVARLERKLNVLEGNSKNGTCLDYLHLVSRTQMFWLVAQEAHDALEKEVGRKILVIEERVRDLEAQVTALQINSEGMMFVLSGRQ